MINFENIEDLVAYMFESLDNEDNLVSAITNKEMTIEVMHELLNYENVILNSCEIDDDCDYNREYRVSLYDDTESDYWYVNVEKDFDSKTGKYIGADGYVLFHGNVNSKAMVDMQKNEFMPLDEYDLFTIGEEIEEDDYEDENDVENINSDAEVNDEYTDSGYSVTVKVDLDTVEAEKIIRDMEKNMKRKLSNMFDLLYRPYPHLYEYRPLSMSFFL